MNIKMDFNNGYVRNSLTQSIEIKRLDWILSYSANVTRDAVLELISSRKSTAQFYVPKSYHELLSAAAEKMENEAEKKIGFRMFSPEILTKLYECGKKYFTYEYRRSNIDGKIMWVECYAELMCDLETGDIILSCSLRDIDERKKLELSLGNKVENDNVTGLYTPKTAAGILVEITSDKLTMYQRCAMLVVGIDDFDVIQLRLKKRTLDELECCITKILRDSFESNTIMSHISDGKFIIFIKDVKSDKLVFEQVDEICKHIRLSHYEDGVETKITASVGIDFSVMDRANFNDMFKNADDGLTEVKSLGKNKYGVLNHILLNQQPNYAHQNCMAKDYMNSFCMMEEIDEIVFIIDELTYDLLYINTAGKKMLNLNDDSGYLGIKCYEMIQGLSHPCSFCCEHTPNSCAYHTWTHNNVKLHKRFLIKDKMMKWNNRSARLEMFIDISEFENLKSDNLSGKFCENILLECTATLLSTETLDGAMNAILQKICNYYEADRAFLLERDSTNNTAVNTFEWCETGIAPRINENNIILLDTLPRWMEAFETNEAVYSADIKAIEKTNPIEYKMARARNVTSFYAIPYNIPNVLSGYIGVDNPRANLKDGMLLESLSYSIVSEISKRRLQKRQEFLSYHDILTGLLNRNSYIEFIALTRQEALSSMGVIVVDINGLKQINRAYGHKYGNKIIVQIADLLRHHFADSHIYRFSGDEFVALSTDMTYKEYLKKVQIFKEDIGVTASIGYTWADVDVDAERMIDHADELMLIAKQEHYNHDTDDIGYHRSENMENLIQAINSGFFVMYLQPKADVKTRKIVGAEALVRRINKQGEIVPPGKFIPRLERENLVHFIDLFIFEETCKAFNRWRSLGYELKPISLNFSRATMLQAHLVETVVDLLAKYDIPPELIEIEITESLGELERETIAEISEKMRSQKLKIALDDFGSKYTGMSILSVMTFDVLKVDRSLINELVSNEKCRHVVHHVLDLCRDLGIKSVAEGVETGEQLKVLEEFGCDVVQGYLFNKPLPMSEFEEKYISCST